MTIDRVWRGGGKAWERTSTWWSTTIINEVMHAVQLRGFRGESCWHPAAWSTEGTADAVAHHLAAQRAPNLFDNYPKYRNDRRYDVSLDVRQFAGSEDDASQ